MFCSISNISDAVEKLGQAKSEDSFDEALSYIRGWMKEQGMSPEVCLELDKRAFYQKAYKNTSASTGWG